MSMLSNELFDELITRLSLVEAENKVLRADLRDTNTRLRRHEDIDASRHGLSWCERCGSYRDRQGYKCDDELCAVHAGSD